MIGLSCDISLFRKSVNKRLQISTSIFHPVLLYFPDFFIMILFDSVISFDQKKIIKFRSLLFTGHLDDFRLLFFFLFRKRKKLMAQLKNKSKLIFYVHFQRMRISNPLTVERYKKSFSFISILFSTKLKFLYFVFQVPVLHRILRAYILHNPEISYCQVLFLIKFYFHC